MNVSLLNKLQELKQTISSLDEIKKLSELEEKLNNNEEVMKLAYAKDVASTNYEDALKHFPEDSIEVKNAQKALHQAKLELDLHPAVKSYMEAYKKASIYYNKVNSVLFGDF